MMRRFRAYLLLALIVAVLFSGLEAQAGSKTPEIGTKGQSMVVQAQAMAALHARLAASSRASVLHSIELTVDEAKILANPGVDSTGRFRIGVHRAVGRTVSNKGADLVIRIPGAQGVRLELTKVTGTVAVFNDAGEAHEYTEDGFTHTFLGENVRIRGSAHVSGAGAVALGGNLCDFNATCTENAECASIIPTDIQVARNAYASILFLSVPYYYVCSGGLIADSDPVGEIPYFLTANHCITKDREARSVETFFQYIKASCAVDDTDCTLPRPGDTIGSTIKATGSDGDFTLLQLAATPPNGSVFLGWNSNPVAYNDGLRLYRISHPGGAPQAYSEHVVDPAAPTCSSWPRGERIYSRDTFGATEGGSSGSPVINGDAKVVGQLSGACGTNVYDECDAESNATVDGAFSYYYPKVQPFLGDGISECSKAADCDDGDLCTTDACNDRTCSNTTTSCDDGNLCTADNCDPGNGSCVYNPIDCNDGNACTNDSCLEGVGCQNDLIPGCSNCLARGTKCDPDNDQCCNSCHPIKLKCK